MADVERIRLWVDALRSGKYTQVTGTLKTWEGRMCCLGVACDISGVGQWTDEAEGKRVEVGKEISGYKTKNSSHPYEDVLPPAVAEWYGLQQDPILEYDGDVVGPASFVNDSLGWDFKKIADAIERTYLET